MDDLNTPLGNRPKKQKVSHSPSSATVLSVLALVVAGGAMAWTYIGGGRGARPQPVAVDNNPVSKPEKVDLRSTSHKVNKSQTTSDPNKPARLEDMEPTGRLEQPRITFLHPKATNAQQLSTRPEPALLEKTGMGMIPRISRSGKKPMDAYARPAPGGGTFRIAIVVGGFGLSQSGSKSAIEQLPGSVTLAFAPYGNSLRRWMEMARRDGHELLMQVPMEPNGYPEVNPGKHTLVTDVDASTNIDSLHWTMSRMTNYVGMMNYLGARLSSDASALQPIFKDMADRGLLYLDDRTAFASKAESVAKDVGLPYLGGNIVLDDGRSSSMIGENLQALEKLARRQGHAIGVASAFPKSVAQIVRWIKQAEERGIEIVPVSALVR